MKSGESKLFLAVGSGKLVTVQKLAAGGDPNATNSLGEPLLSETRKPEVAEHVDYFDSRVAVIGACAALVAAFLAIQPWHSPCIA